LRSKLLKHHIALQPNKHIQTWKQIAWTLKEQWWSLSALLETVEYDFLQLQEIVQKKHKKWFPYLSGPKIFHYWSHILQRYWGINLHNSEYIEIAPDTHVLQWSIQLGVISKEEALILSKNQISTRRREVLKGSGISPIEMHSPLWFRSRNGFSFKL
jgi:hypothetical protein